MSHDRSNRPAAGEDGSVLAIALVFVLVVGLIVATLLTRVDVGLRTTRVVRATTDKTYAATPASSMPSSSCG